jgi:hypothetical protein
MILALLSQNKQGAGKPAMTNGNRQEQLGEAARPSRVRV